MAVKVLLSSKVLNIPLRTALVTQQMVQTEMAQEPNDGKPPMLLITAFYSSPLHTGCHIHKPLFFNATEVF